MIGTSDADLCMEYAVGGCTSCWLGPRLVSGGCIVYFDSLPCDGGTVGVPWRRASLIEYLRYGRVGIGEGRRSRLAFFFPWE